MGFLSTELQLDGIFFHYSTQIIRDFNCYGLIKIFYSVIHVGTCIMNTNSNFMF